MLENKMKVLMIWCGLFGCGHYGWFNTMEDCKKIVHEREVAFPQESYVCEERTPNIIERIFE